MEGLTFQGLSSLEVLKLQRNSIGKLTDGAFFDLAKMKVLYVLNMTFNHTKENHLFKTIIRLVLFYFQKFSCTAEDKSE